VVLLVLQINTTRLGKYLQNSVNIQKRVCHSEPARRAPAAQRAPESDANYRQVRVPYEQAQNDKLFGNA